MPKTCYTLQESPEIGRCLIACRDITPGELVLEDTSVAIGPKEMPDVNACVQCFNPASETCSKCSLPLCNKNEQHGCEMFTKWVNKQPMEMKLAAVAPMRLAKAMQQQDGVVIKSLDLLMDHEQDRKMSPDIFHWQRCERIITDLVPDKDRKDVRRSLGLLHINALTVDGGRAIFPTFSFMSHSCENNARHILERTDKGTYNIKVYSQRAIPKGEEITITYINLLRGRRERRDNLRSQWFFDCACARCSRNPESALDAELNGVFCPNCKTDKQLLQETEDSYNCAKCETEVTFESVQRLTSVMQSTFDETEKIQENMEQLLEYYSSYLPPNHYLNIICKRLLSQLYREDDPTQVPNKLKMSRKMVALFEELDPGLSRSRGLAYVELTKAVKAMKTGAKNKEIDRYKKIIEQCLNMEPEDSLAGKILLSFRQKMK